jgi:hypothetical protein
VKVDDQSTPKLFTPKDIVLPKVVMYYPEGFDFLVRFVNLTLYSLPPGITSVLKVYFSLVFSLGSYPQ